MVAAGRIIRIISTKSIAHGRLTVTDIARSRRFDDAVLGWPVLLEIPEGADEATRPQLRFLFSGVIDNIGNALIGLRPVATDTFHEDHSGLDHIAFPVANRAELDAAAAYLDELSVAHEDMKGIASAASSGRASHRTGSA
jgi:glyoxylase I family protein